MTDGGGPAWRDDLVAIIRERSFRTGHFTLASGRESALYFNLKPTMMDPRGGALIAGAALDALHAEAPDFVGGLAMGAVPTLGAIAAVGWLQGRPLRTFFVRQGAKDHGTKDLIEGLAAGESLAGRRTTVIDDVATSGGSILKAAEAARAAGAIVESALVIVNRQEGAAEHLAAHGVRLASLLRASDFAAV